MATSDLIAEHAWPKYLGRLLILNEPDSLPVIDTRWVGHGTCQGFRGASLEPQYGSLSSNASSCVSPRRFRGPQKA